MRWYVKGGRYKIVSLKTTDKNHARDKAMRLWMEFSQQVNSGGTVFEKKIKDIIDEYITYLDKLVEVGQVKKITVASLGILLTRANHIT